MKYLILAFFCVVTIQAVSQNTEKRRLHAFIFADTNDESIGKGCSQDVRNMIKELGVISMAINYELKQYTFDGFNYDTGYVSKMIESPGIGDSDLVIIYFSSHGSKAINDDTAKRFPNILFPARRYHFPYNVESIHDAFKSRHHVKLLLTIVDACNAFDTYPRSSVIDYKNDYTHDFPQTLSLHESLFYNLFFKDSKGDLIISSSQAGQTSLTTSQGGSVFTNEFIRQCQNFSKNFQGLDVVPATWERFLQTLQYSTKARALQISVEAWNDTTIRYPVWKNRLTTILDRQSEISYPELQIQSWGQEVNAEGFTKKFFLVTKTRSIPEVLYNQVKKVTFYFKDLPTGQETTCYGTIENKFTVTYFIKESTLVFASVEFLDGRVLEVTTIN